MTSYGSSYVKSLKSINTELKRISEHSKKLKKEKKDIEGRLYKWMENSDMKEYEGYKKDKLKPKDKIPTIKRKKKEKVSEAIRLLTEAGIPDPSEFYGELMKTQKPIPLIQE